MSGELDGSSRTCGLLTKRQPSSIQTPPHDPVGSKTVERMPERRGRVLFKKEMPRPGKTVPGQQSEKNPVRPTRRSPGANTDERTPSAREMQHSRYWVSMLAQIESEEFRKICVAAHPVLCNPCAMPPTVATSVSNNSRSWRLEARQRCSKSICIRFIGSTYGLRSSIARCSVRSRSSNCR